VLEQEESTAVADCLGLFRETSPVAGLASLVLNRFATIDLDDELIGSGSCRNKSLLICNTLLK
jgi:hypothetical protein